MSKDKELEKEGAEEVTGGETRRAGDEEAESEETPNYRCVHCKHEFYYDDSDLSEPSRCPSCLRKGGLELTNYGYTKRRGWIFPIAVAGTVLAAGVAYSMQKADDSPATAALAPMSASALEDVLGGSGESSGATAFESADEIEALSDAIEESDATTPEGKVDALAAYLGERRSERAFTSLPLDTPRDTTIRSGEWAARIITTEEQVALYPLEVALASTLALREAGVPAMVAEIWNLSDTNAPPDPSGQIGYFGVALVPDGAENDDGATYWDMYLGHEVDPESARVLSDAQAVAAYLSTRGLYRLVHEHDPTRALRDVEKALDLDERSPSIRSVRGTIITQNGGLQEGFEELQAASTIRRDAPRLNNLAGLYVAFERIDDADSAVTAALEEAPDFAFAHANLAVIHMVEGNMEDARRELQRAEELHAELHVLPSLWAQFHLANRDEAQAIRWMETAVERNPNNIQTRMAAAQIFFSVGRMNAARAQVQALLELVPSDRQGRFREEIRARMNESVLEEPEEGWEDLESDVGSASGGDSGLGLGLGDDFDLGGSGPSLLDGQLDGGDLNLGGGGDFNLGGGGLQLGGGGAAGGGGSRFRLQY